MPTAGIEHWTSVLRVGLHQGLDLGVQRVTGCAQVSEHPGQLGQHHGRRVRAYDHHGLGIQGGEDLLGQAVVHPGCLPLEPCGNPLAACRAQGGRGRPGPEQIQYGRAVQPRPEDPFQGRVDLGQQSPQPIAGGGDLLGQVVIEAAEHRLLGNLFIGHRD
jgi:hypothetical protein